MKLPPLPDAEASDARRLVQGRTIAEPFAALKDLEREDVQAWYAAQAELTAQLVNRDSAEWRGIRDLVASLPLYETDFCAVAAYEEGCYFLDQPAGAEEIGLYHVDRDGAVSTVLTSADLPGENRCIHESCLELSPDRSYLALTTHARGADVHSLQVFDCSAGTLLPDRIDALIEPAVSWAEDSRGFYYGALRSLFDPQAADCLNYHALGAVEDQCLMTAEAGDQSQWIAMSPQVLNERYLLLRCYSYRRGGASLYLLTRDQTCDPQLLVPGFDTQIHLLGVGEDQATLMLRRPGDDVSLLFLRVRDDGSVEQRECALTCDLPIARPFPAFRANTALAMGNTLYITCLEHGSHVIRVFDRQGKSRETVPALTPGTVIGMRPWDGGRLLLRLTSYLNPLGFYLSNTEFTEPQVLAVPEPHWALSIDGSVRQEFVTAADGVQVPVFIVGTADGGPKPLLLYGYGGFAQSITPVFNPDLICWLQLGGRYAVANIRGGGEYGEHWHEAALGKHRRVAFDDFAAAADYLVAENYCGREQLALRGLSNGGLLVGASLVLRPDIAAAVISEVPLLDMLAILDMPGGGVLFREYGAIDDDAEVLEAVLSYDPLRNVRKGERYPAVLAVPGDSDERASPAQSARFVAALQSAGTGEPRAFLDIVEGEGHVAWSTESRAASMADEMCFLKHFLPGVGALSEPAG